MKIKLSIGLLFFFLLPGAAIAADDTLYVENVIDSYGVISAANAIGEPDSIRAHIRDEQAFLKLDFGQASQGDLIVYFNLIDYPVWSTIDFLNEASEIVATTSVSGSSGTLSPAAFGAPKTQ